jgi:peptide/nickel transport system ATP-binding protein
VTAPLLEIDQLDVEFTGSRKLHAVRGLSLSVEAGRVLCIIGESGSGKSVTMQAVMRLLPERTTRYGGEIRLGGRNVLAMRPAELRAIRGRQVAMVFQEPMTALDPVHTIGQLLAGSIARREQLGGRAARARAVEMLELVGVPDPQRRIDAYPHELSGGLRQRAMIALAVASRPALLLADEPTTALDATVQIQVLLLLRKLQRELGMALVLVTHDLGVAAEIADDVAVMYAGRLVETGPVSAVLRSPAHPYTAALMGSSVHGVAPGAHLPAIGGAPPDLAHLPAGCSFAPRCTCVVASCRHEDPPERQQGARMIRCPVQEFPSVSRI